MFDGEKEVHLVRQDVLLYMQAIAAISFSVDSTIDVTRIRITCLSPLLSVIDFTSV